MKNKKPVIAVVPQMNLEKHELFVRSVYLKALRGAGAIPLILPLYAGTDDLAQLLELADGVLFTGGPDIHPAHYGQDTHLHCGSVCPERDRLELALLPLAIDAKKPILGICRGIQLLNVALSGTLYQDLPSQFRQEFPIAHDQPFDPALPAHTVEVVAGTLLERIVTGKGRNAADTCAVGADHPADHAGDTGIRLPVNSLHHQAVCNLAPGLIASAYAPGNLIEAIEKPDYPAFFLGVQWHPEYMWEQDAVAAQIFAAFVEAAAED